MMLRASLSALVLAAVASPAVAQHAEVSNVLYLNRCQPECMVTGGTMNDARQHIATLPVLGPHTIGEFQNNNHEIGAAADAEWNAIVQCVKEIYSPFNIIVTDQPPTGTGNYTEAMVGGIAADVGKEADVGGTAPAHTSCDPNDNAISFTFSNSTFYFYPANAQQYRIWQLCGVIGQESAHHYGLDHSYEYFDGDSACNDPMTYRGDCGGQKFFRNKAAKCGEFNGPRDCFCGGLQNTHVKLMSVFGPGTNALIPPPTITVTSPANNSPAQNGQVVTFMAGSKRGVSKSELWLNGYKWAEVEGAPYGANGQPNPSTYNLLFPTAVPDGVIDIQVIAYDDLDAMGTSETIRVTKGAPCASAASCAKGQQCDGEGRCYWEPPVGELGDSCDYNQFCTSNLCVETNEGGYCSEACIVGATDTCPKDFECIQNGAEGSCLPKADDPGCFDCSSGRGVSWPHAGLSLAVLGLIVRRRRKRAR